MKFEISLMHDEENLSFVRAVGLALFSLVLLFNYLLSNDFLSVALTLVACFMVLFCRFDDILPYILYFASFAYLFRFGQWNLYILIQSCFILRCILIKRSNSQYLIIGIVYILFHIVSTSLSSYKLGIFIPFVSMISLLFAAVIYTESQRTKCLQYYVFGFFVSSILGIFATNTRLAQILDSNPIRLGTGAITQRFGGLMPDCNFYTVMSIIVIAVLCFTQYQSGIKPLLRTIELIALVILGAITFSKSFYLCLVIIAFFAGFFSELQYKKYVLLAIVFASIGYYIFHDRVDLILEAVVGRFTTSTGDMNSFTNGRYLYWIRYMKDFSSSIDSILIGKGADALLDGHIVAHNTYIEILYKFGIFGFLSDVLFIAYVKKIMVVQISKFKIYLILPTLLLLLLIFNLSAYSFYPLWSCILASLIALNSNAYSNYKEEIVY